MFYWIFIVDWQGTGRLRESRRTTQLLIGKVHMSIIRSEDVSHILLKRSTATEIPLEDNILSDQDFQILSSNKQVVKNQNHQVCYQSYALPLQLQIPLPLLLHLRLPQHVLLLLPLPLPTLSLPLLLRMALNRKPR